MSDVYCKICRNSGAVSNTPIPGEVIDYKCPRCGNVKKRDILPDIFDAAFLSEKRYLLSGFTRERTERGQQAIIFTSENTNEIYNNLLGMSVLEKKDKLLQAFANKTKTPGDLISIIADQDYPLAYAANMDELVYYIKYLHKSGLISVSDILPQKYSVTINGWSKLEDLNKQKGQSDQAFVAMSFSDVLKPIYIEGIKPAIEETGYRPIAGC